MARQKKKIGTIVKSGPMFESRPLGQSGQMFSTLGDARAFFRRFGGQSGPVAPGVKPTGGGGGFVTFEGDAETDVSRQEQVFVTYNLLT